MSRLRVALRLVLTLVALVAANDFLLQPYHGLDDRGFRREPVRLMAPAILASHTDDDEHAALPGGDGPGAALPTDATHPDPARLRVLATVASSAATPRLHPPRAGPSRAPPPPSSIAG